MSDGLPSASGARLAGDDYQHALTWVHALKLLLVDGDVTKVKFEADYAGNVDDLVVHRVGQPTLYQQIKFVVSQKHPLTHDWFTTPSRGMKRSPLQRFYESYIKLSSADQVPPEMALQTNRLPAAADPMLQLVSGTNCKLVPRLTAQAPGSAAGKVRGRWAEHLGITQEQLLSFLDHLAIRAGRSDLDDLQERCAWAMRAVGLRSDVAAVLAGLGALRELIRTGVRELDAEAVEDVANRLHLLAEEPRATLLIQSLRADPWPETATASVDWVDLFEGEDAVSRRQLKNPSDWNGRLKSELADAVERIRRARIADVEVWGTMRLATGLLVGQQLSEVAGFRIAIPGREGEWSSAMRREPSGMAREELEIGQGQDLAVALAVSQAIREDVLSHIRECELPVSRLVVFTPAGGSSRHSVPSPESGLGLAGAISAALREETSSHRAALHLFQAVPLPLAVMVGHLWNRMPMTHLYEDLGPGAGYTSSFTI
jgi:hypothetical protein